MMFSSANPIGPNEVTVFYLDVYGFLVNYVHPMELVEHRRKYYHLLMTAVLESLGFDLSKIRFVDESSFSYRKEYMVDVLRTCALMTQQDAKDTSEETVETEMLSPLLCCIYQSLSEQYLDIDIQFGGEDQVCMILLPEKLHILNSVGLAWTIPSLNQIPAFAWL
jgi:tyrosyl-tRNA synthetase